VHCPTLSPTSVSNIIILEVGREGSKPFDSPREAKSSEADATAKVGTISKKAAFSLLI
jgi:hypothetical protein